MHSVSRGDTPTAAAALNSRDSTFSMPSDHSVVVWERQALGRDKFDRERYTSTKRVWSTENRSSPYRSSSVLSASASLSAKRRAIGRHETFVDNSSRYRSAIGRSESSSSLYSSPQTGKGERDVCSPGYGGSPNMERPSKAVDGHHYRGTYVSPGNARPFSSPHFHGNQNDSEVLGSRDRERSRFSSPPYTWDASNRGRDYRDRAWSRPDNRRAYPLPKLDSSREWNQSDRELLEGRIDRYSSVSGREAGFPDVLSANSREYPRHEWRATDRLPQSGISSQLPVYNSLYNRENRNASLAFEVPGAISPHQHSPMQSPFSHESDQDCGPSTSKKRPRLTWGQGLAKYEKERIGEDLSVAKKSEEGSVYVGALQSDGSVASVLQINNVLPCLDDWHPSEEHMQNSDACIRGGSQAELIETSFRDSLVYSSEKESTREPLAKENVDYCVNVSNNQECGSPEVEVAETSASHCPVLQYMQNFLNSSQQGLPALSKEILTQHVEKVELEIDRLEKEIARLNAEHDVHTLLSENFEETVPVSKVEVSRTNSLVGFLKPPISPLSVHNMLPTPADTSVATVGTVGAGECGLSDSLEVVVLALDSLNERGVLDPVVHQTDEGGMSGTKVQSVIPATWNDFLAAQPRKVKGEAISVECDMSRAFEEDSKDSIASIFSSNQQIAEESSGALAHLNAPQGKKDPHVGRLDCKLEESSVWKCTAERHDRIKHLLELKVIEEKRLERFTEGVLAIKYRAKREVWKQEQIGTYSSKDRDKCFVTWEPDIATPSRQSSLRMCPNLTSGSFVPDTHNEEVEVAEKLLVESPADAKREYMRMPPMILGQKERDSHRFESKNALVVDPVAADQERKSVNPWTAEEKRIFLEKYSLLGKNLRKIASFLEHKTVADCVQFFYLNQKTEEFQKIHRRHQLKKRRECNSSALYLATTTSVSSRHCEANAAHVEGLSLVAAAAAAISVPGEFSRSSRNPAIKPFPLGSSCSKACRDLYLIKQASTTSTLTGKDSNVEHLGGKCAQNTHSRSFKRPSEVLQWRSQWNDSERDLFMKAVAMFGKDFESISLYIGTKSRGQCRTYFSKARKRLDLDQLVERHATLLENKAHDENMLKDMQSKNVDLHINGIEIDSDFKMGTDLFEQQLKAEMSPLHVNSCVASEVRCNSPHGNQEVISALSCPKTLLAAGHTGSMSVGGNAGEQNVDKPLNQGPCSSFRGRNGTVDVCGNSIKTGVLPLESFHGCMTDCEEATQIRTEPMGVKSETLPSHMCIGVSKSGSSCIHGTCPSTMVSALVPSSLASTSVVQSPQVKDKSVRMTEVKVRREPTSWTQEEKEKFVDVLKVHGKNWDLLCKSLPAKSLMQIKTYFQNSKAKLGLRSDGLVNNPGRAGTSWKRKVDDSDLSSNAGSAGQMLSQKASVVLDDGSLKVSPSILAPSGGSGSNMLSAEALAYANIFGRKLLEDSINAQKVFQAMGLVQNAASPGILPMLTTPVFSQPNLVSSQQPYMHNSSANMKMPQFMNHQQAEQSVSSLVVVDPSSSVGVHQAHQLQPQQQVAGTLQDAALQSVHKQPPQTDQNTLLQHVLQPNQQLQQMAEAVLQQLLPHAAQRHQQQLQLAAQQMSHHFQPVLSQHQNQSNQQVSSQATSGMVSVPMATGHQKPQHSVLSQCQLHQMHGKLQTSLQQHQQVPQLNQLQLLQLQRQQQQQLLLLQLQQAQVQAFSQSQQMQKQTLHMQQNHNLSSEQHQSAFSRGITHLYSVSGEAPKQNEFDIQLISKSHQGASGDVCQPLVLNQTMEVPIKSQVVSEQSPTGDVKLFGQSLLLQPASAHQHSNAKILSSLSTSAASSALPTGIHEGTIVSNMPTKAPWDHVVQGMGGVQITRPNAFNNGGPSCTTDSNKGDNSVGVQEPVSCSNERFRTEARVTNNGKAVEPNSLLHASQLPDGNALASVQTSLDNCTILNITSLPCGPSGEALRCEKSSQAANLDHGMANSVSGSSGREVVAPQGLPRVLDALVALAEWRLQNSSGCSGKLTDEFLSQSWEALQKDPGSLIEAGKASGCLSQLYSEGPQMLQLLKERLLSSHSGVIPAPEGALLSNDGQIVSSQAMLPHTGVHDSARSDCVPLEADGTGLSNG